MTIFRLAVALALGLLVSTATAAENYALEIRNALKRECGQDFPDFQFKSTPVGTFGVGTVYAEKTKRTKSVEAAMLLAHPSTWWADGVTDSEKSTLLSRLFIEGDLGCGPGLTESLTRHLSLAIVLPGLARLLSLSGNTQLNKDVTVNLHATAAKLRKMDWLELVTLARSGKIKSSVADQLKSMHYVVAAQDIVLIGYKAEITVDAAKNGELDLKLTDAAKPTPAQAAKDASVTVKADSSIKGKFTAEVAGPVVAAILFSDPLPFPSSSALTSPTWKPVHVDLISTVEKLEQSTAAK